MLEGVISDLKLVELVDVSLGLSEEEDEEEERSRWELCGVVRL